MDNAWVTTTWPVTLSGPLMPFEQRAIPHYHITKDRFMSTDSVSNTSGASSTHALHHKHKSAEARSRRNNEVDSNSSSTKAAPSTPAVSVNSSGQTTGQVINVTA